MMVTLIPITNTVVLDAFYKVLEILGLRIFSILLVYCSKFGLLRNILMI